MRQPPLYAAADAASLKGQRTYLRLLRAQLAFPLFSTGAAIVLTGKEGGVALVLLFVVGLAASIVMQLRRPEGEWFDGRVIAESMKTIAWRFAMKVPPYNGGLTDAQAVAELNKRVADVIAERKKMSGAIAAKGAGAQVTDAMKEIRALPWKERRPIYLDERLDDQLNWYKNKGGLNDDLAGRWLSFVSILQFVGLILAVLRAADVIQINLFGVLGAAIGAALAWLQAKRHQDLSRSYGFAALELGLIRSRADAPASEDQYVKFVEDAEEAMSREHTAWHAKRLQ
jgi:conflict system pore-forming effector with SLATT domain